MATVTENAPFLSAVVFDDVWFVEFWARIALLAWVLPVTATLAPLTLAPAFGAVIVSFGFAVSRTYVIGFSVATVSIQPVRRASGT